MFTTLKAYCPRLAVFLKPPGARALSMLLSALIIIYFFIPQMGDVWGDLHPKLKDIFESANEASIRSSSQTHTSRGQTTCAVIGPA